MAAAQLIACRLRAQADFELPVAFGARWAETRDDRPESVGKIAAMADQITLFPGRTDDRKVIADAVKGCDGVLCVLVPWGVTGYSSNTAQAVLDFADPAARLVFSCDWHISLDGKDRYSWHLRALVALFGPIAR